MSKKHDTLHSRTDKARTAILKAIDGVDETQCVSQIVSGEWTVKEITGHLVSFGDVFRSVIRTIIEQDVQQYDYHIRTDDGFTEWNLKQAAIKKNWSWQRVRDDLDSDYADTKSLIDTLSVEDLSKRGIVPWKLTGEDANPVKVTPKNSTTPDAIFKIHAHHFKHHAAIIEEWKKTIMTRG